MLNRRWLDVYAAEVDDQELKDVLVAGPGGAQDAAARRA
jgi:hypothetical protein